MVLRRVAMVVVLLAGCSSAPSPDAQFVDGADSPSRDGSDALADIVVSDRVDVSSDVADVLVDAPADVARDIVDVPPDVPPPPPCTTRVIYGSAWIHPPAHPDPFDDVPGVVTWDGACGTDGSGNSVATLSNGWMPVFSGRGSCVIDMEYSASCTGVPARCTTRITYGPSWMRAPGHATSYDDVPSAVLWSGVCHASGAQSFAQLSNGWTPYFSGANGCDLAFRYEQCGGLYTNPVVANDCPDPGVLRDGAQYVMACTSGNAPDSFPIRTSPDLVTWTSRGFIFPAGHHPTWAASDFWAPEIHRVGTGYVAYFSARNSADGHLSIGAASATSALGPFTDIGHPLVHDPTFGLIDASEYEAPDGTRYVIWKVDGNAVGQHTPIRIQPLAPDGLSLVGSPATLITNDQAWEGGVVEGPWMIDRGGTFYLFYSGNGYASPSYALGVARASSPLGPFTKAPAPIVTSQGAWQGPGHGSVVVGPRGEDVFVYHAWVAGRIGMSPGREVLVDWIFWNAGWPELLEAPSSPSLPIP
jgi:GH43 family beta-xylosidase